MEKRNSVLIVDDETECIMALTNILSSEYTLYAAKDGLKALEVAIEQLPDVIVLDVLMPGMSGDAVLSLLRNTEETRDIPVIFVTGLVKEEFEEKSQVIGAEDYISKPFTPAIVKLRVRNQMKIVNRTRALDEIILGVLTEVQRLETSFDSAKASEIAHVLNVIKGITHIVESHDMTEKTKGNLQKIEAASRNLVSLIGQTAK